MSDERLSVSLHGSTAKPGMLVDLFDTQRGRIERGLLMLLRQVPAHGEFHNQYYSADILVAGTGRRVTVPVDFIRLSFPYRDSLSQDEWEAAGAYRHMLSQTGVATKVLKDLRRDIVAGKADQWLPASSPFSDNVQVPWYAAVQALSALIEDQERTDKGQDIIR